MIKDIYGIFLNLNESLRTEYVFIDKVSGSGWTGKYLVLGHDAGTHDQEPNILPSSLTRPSQ